ncbi:MAG: hypothetical protein ACOCV8_05415 [Spirochaetota bacterium]
MVDKKLYKKLIRLMHPDRFNIEIQKKLTQYVNSAKESGDNTKLEILDNILENRFNLNDLHIEIELLKEDNERLTKENEVLKEELMESASYNTTDREYDKLKKELEELKNVNEMLKAKLFDILNKDNSNSQNTSEKGKKKK